MSPLSASNSSDRTLSPRTASSAATSTKTRRGRSRSTLRPSRQRPHPIPLTVRSTVQWWLLAAKRRSARKALLAGGSVATLAMLAIVPARIGSEAIALSDCQEVIKSGAEISREQISNLLTVPNGASREAVRQVIDTPYCALPSLTGDSATSHAGIETSSRPTKGSADVIEREAYPLAFDPGAWVVVNYSAGEGAREEADEKTNEKASEYVGYDLIFRP